MASEQPLRAGLRVQRGTGRGLWGRRPGSFLGPGQGPSAELCRPCGSRGEGLVSQGRDHARLHTPLPRRVCPALCQAAVLPLGPASKEHDPDGEGRPTCPDHPRELCRAGLGVTHGIRVRQTERKGSLEEPQRAASCFPLWEVRAPHRLQDGRAVRDLGGQGPEAGSTLLEQVPAAALEQSLPREDLTVSREAWPSHGSHVRLHVAWHLAQGDRASVCCGQWSGCLRSRDGCSPEIRRPCLTQELPLTTSGSGYEPPPHHSPWPA